MIIETSNWGWPQWIIIVLSLYGLFIEIKRHGEQRRGHHNLPTHLFSMVITYWIFIAGGFFK